MSSINLCHDRAYKWLNPDSPVYRSYLIFCPSVQIDVPGILVTDLYLCIIHIEKLTLSPKVTSGNEQVMSSREGP